MLTQLSSVKARLGILDANSTYNALLTTAIKAASGRFARECNRIFDRGVNVTHEFPAFHTELIPPRYPIEAVAGFDLKETEAIGWVPQTPVPDYLIRQAGEIPCIVSIVGSALGNTEQLARMTYTGGYVLPGTVAGAGQTALPPEIEAQCIEQVAYWYARRDQLGLTSVSGQGGSIQALSSLDLLPSVKAVLKAYRRFNP